MQVITVEDCRNLRERFMEFANRQEQHTFPFLAMINLRLDTTLEAIEKDGEVKNQKDINAMFRVVLRVMGEDYSAYKENSNE